MDRNDHRPHICIFTDGAAEATGVSVGGVIMEIGRDTEFFSEQVPEDLVRHWKAFGKDQVIGQAELYPILMSRVLWEKRIMGRKVLWFVDNESARVAAVKFTSPVSDSAELLWALSKVVVRSLSLDWYARVPSKCNCADAPSRLDVAACLAKGWKRAPSVHTSVQELKGLHGQH
jgi:hypothetical protein